MDGNDAAYDVIRDGNSPLRLTIAQFAIARLVIAAQMAGAEAALSVEGNGAWDGAQAANLLLTLHRLDAEGAHGGAKLEEMEAAVRVAIAAGAGARLELRSRLRARRGR